MNQNARLEGLSYEKGCYAENLHKKARAAAGFVSAVVGLLFAGALALVLFEQLLT